MKLFKNSVGRPSNEIKNKRKIFIASAIVLCVSLVSVLGYALTKVSTNRLIGAVTMNSILPDYRVGVDQISCAYANATDKLSCTYTWNLKVNKVYKLVTSAKITKVGGDKYPKGYQERVATGIVYYDINDSLTIAIDDGYSKNKAIEFTVHTKAYDKKGKLLYSFDYVHTVNLGDQKVKSNPKGSITNISISDKSKTTTSKTTTKKTTTKKTTTKKTTTKKTTTKKTTTKKTTTKKTLTLSCQASRTVGNPVTCYVTSNGKAVKGAKISLPSSSIARIKNVSDNEFQVIYNDTIFDLYRGQVNFDSGNKRNYVATVITATLNGTKATDIVKVYESTAPSSLTLNCPTSAKVNEKFLCKTNKIGVKITIGGARALDENVDSVYVTTSGDMSKSVKYTNALFNGKVVAEKYIYKDKNGTYVNAYITAEKKGFTTVKKVVKIYK